MTMGEEGIKKRSKIAWRHLWWMTHNCFQLLLKMKMRSRYIKLKVEHYRLFMFSPPKISWVIWGIKYIYLLLFTVFFLIQPSSKQIICFGFGKQNSVLPIVFFNVFHRFRQAKFAYGGSILSSSQFLLLPYRCLNK